MLLFNQAVLISVSKLVLIRWGNNLNIWKHWWKGLMCLSNLCLSFSQMKCTSKYLIFEEKVFVHLSSKFTQIIQGITWILVSHFYMKLTSETVVAWKLARWKNMYFINQLINLIHLSLILILNPSLSLNHYLKNEIMAFISVFFIVLVAIYLFCF